MGMLIISQYASWEACLLFKYLSTCTCQLYKFTQQNTYLLIPLNLRTQLHSTTQWSCCASCACYTPCASRWRIASRWWAPRWRITHRILVTPEPCRFITLSHSQYAYYFILYRGKWLDSSWRTYLSVFAAGFISVRRLWYSYIWLWYSYIWFVVYCDISIYVIGLHFSKILEYPSR